MPSLTKSPKTRQKLRIKSPSKLCKRTIQNSAENLIQIATEEYGEQYAEFYLNRAVKKNSNKKKKSLFNSAKYSRRKNTGKCRTKWRKWRN
jgi:hypothetical protein